MFSQTTLQPMIAAAQSARQNAALLAQVGAVYRYADAAIAARRPLCRQSGRCCQFDRMQHNLLVSTVELACFLRSTRLERIAEPVCGTCPFLRRSPARCAARRGRPLGCRIFYCDPSAQWWQQDLYNQLHARLVRLHDRFDIPYFYAEWLAVLTAARPTPT